MVTLTGLWKLFLDGLRVLKTPLRRWQEWRHLAREKQGIHDLAVSNLGTVRSQPNCLRDGRTISEAYTATKAQKKKQLILGITSGRSGMKWVYQIFHAHANAVGCGERNAFHEAFYRYVKVNDLAVDVSGVLELTKHDILMDWQKADISLVVSPYFSHDFLHLYEALQADRVIWGITDPAFTITSFFNKGWYLREDFRTDAHLAGGSQPYEIRRWNHFLGRITPRGPLYEPWRTLTRVGKIAWFVNRVHMEIWQAIQQLPRDKVWIFRLEEADQNYAYYQRLARCFGLSPLLSEKRFLALKGKAAFAGENLTHTWSEEENAHFQEYAAEYIKLYSSGQLSAPGYLSS